MTVLLNSVNNPHMAHQVTVTERTMGKNLYFRPVIVHPDTYVVERDHPSFSRYLDDDLILITDGIEQYFGTFGRQKNPAPACGRSSAEQRVS